MAGDNNATCELCGHDMTDNLHGFDQNDWSLAEDGSLVYSGHCTYCKDCQFHADYRKAYAARLLG